MSDAKPKSSMTELTEYVNLAIALAMFIFWTYQICRSLHKYVTSAGDQRHRRELIRVHFALLAGNCLYMWFECDGDKHFLPAFYIMQLFISQVQIYSFNLVCQDPKEPVSQLSEKG